MNRRNMLAVVVAIAVFSAGLGWMAGQRIKSPAEIAAETGPPDPSLITVPVELRELSSRVVVRGTVTSAGSTEITVSGAADGAALITRLPVEVGDELIEGDVALEVAGRPVLVLQGELPAYRNLGPGMDGPDVEQLEIALNRMGYDPGNIDGEYSVTTGNAVAAMYKDAGYKANEPSPEAVESVDAARDRVSAAKKALTDAESAGSSGGGGVQKSELIRLDLDITHAQESLSDAKTEKANLVESKESAASDLTAAEETQSIAEERLRQAEEDDTHPDTGEAPTEDQLDELRAALEAATGAVAAAEEAKDQIDESYEADLVAADRAIRDAGKNLEVAQASKNETIQAASESQEPAGPDTSELRKELADANDDLARIQADTGVSLPSTEFRFVKTLPSTVQAVNVELGETPSGAALSISGASTVLESSVPAGDNELVEEGLEGTADDSENGISIRVKITKLATEPSSGSTAGERYEMVLVPLDDVPEDAMFQSLRITLPISSTGGEVLAVPLAAVSAGSSGEARVEVAKADGSTELVEVNTGLSAEGYVEVRPVASGELKEGDRVVVGRDLLLPGSGTEEEGSSDSADGDS